MKNFTVEEINLMCCFNTSSRKRLIDDMKSGTLNDMEMCIRDRHCTCGLAGFCSHD